jgi:2-succinyl-6-hydroxy-2,4-cyclohexadiene-1-carboxylate synthase
MLYYKIEGEGKTFVFLHGFLESSTMWKYLDFNALHTKKILIDLPGHGKSNDVITASPSIHYMAEKVNQILLSNPEEEFIVVGHSMGGYVALELAKINTSVSKVILLNSNFWQDSIEKQKDRNRVVEILKSAKDKFIQEAIPNLFSYPENYQEQINEIIQEAKSFTVEGISFATKAMRDREDNSSWVNIYSNKVYVIQGELDKTAPLEVMLEKLPKNVGFSLIQNAGHMTHIEASDKVLEILNSFS